MSATQSPISPRLPETPAHEGGQVAAPTGATPIELPGPPAPPSTRLIRMSMPVRWRDLDAFNHVNNAQYLSYLEEARLQWMLTLPGQGMNEHVAPVVAAAHLNYRRPIGWPGTLTIELFVERLGTTSVSIGHRITADGDGETLFCDGHTVLVWIDRVGGGATALPDAVREACSPA
jgi:acyl-CoA thioester hydrolase